MTPPDVGRAVPVEGGLRARTGVPVDVTWGVGLGRELGPPGLRSRSYP